jgi:hypothetical protein
VEKGSSCGDRGVVADRGLSSRAVLISLAFVAIGIVVALLAVSDPGPEDQPDSSAEETPSSKNDPRPPLESAEGSDSARADAPKQEGGEANPQVRTRILAVSGSVIDARSRSVVPSVEVEAFAKPLPGGKEARAKTQSDAQGRYSLDLVIPADMAWDPEVWAVRVVARGDRFETVNARLLEADFRPHATDSSAFVANHDIEVVLQLAWSGRLVRESDGTPIQGGTATLLAVAPRPTLPRPLGDAQTDATGRFLMRLETVESSDLAMLGAADGFVAKMIPVAPDPARVFDCGTFALGEGVCLEGFATTTNGTAPAATGIQVLMKAPGDAWMFLQSGSWAIRDGSLVRRNAEGSIGPDGKFRVCGLAPDEYSVFVRYEGCATGSPLEQLEVRAPASGVRMQLARAVYRLHVFDSKSGKQLERSRFCFDELQDVCCHIEGDFVIATDPGIESPGRIVADGYRAMKCALPALAPSEVRDLEIRLEPLASQVSCTIVVTSPAGAPVEDIEVRFRGETGQVDGQAPMTSLAHTSADGRHELPPLVPGTYHFEIDPFRHGDPSVETWLGAQLDLDIREGMKPVEVRFEEGGLVQATVTRSDGMSIDARTWLVRTPGSEPDQIDWRNDEGTFGGWIPKQAILRLAKPLPSGPWTLRFEADGCVSQDVVVNLAAGATTAIAVTLEAGPPR